MASDMEFNESAPPSMEAPKADGPSEEPSKDCTAPAESPETKPSSQVHKDVEEVHSGHHCPHNYAYREHWNNSPPMGGQETRQPDPNYVVHSFNSHRAPSPYVSEYVSEYGHGSPPMDITRYGGSGARGDEYFQNRGGDGDHITFIFSDENPNACRIV